jgi:hypothetical protein
MKSEPHPPMTLSAAAAAQIRLTVLMPGLGRPKSSPIPPRWLLGMVRKRACLIGVSGWSAPNAVAARSIW